MGDSDIIFDGREATSVLAAAYIPAGDDSNSQPGFESDVNPDIDADMDDCEDEHVDDLTAHNAKFTGIGIGEDEYHDRESDHEHEATGTGKKRKNTNTTTRKYSRKRTLILSGTHTVTSEDITLQDSGGTLQGEPHQAPGIFGRYNEGERHRMAAYHRKVTATPDSFDALMLEMREKGFSDQQIFEELAKDCGVVYNVKTISTRIMRICFMQVENTNMLLKEGYKEWKFEEDRVLLQAYALADIEVNYDIERTRAWRFRKGSEYMRRLNKDALFSANACRERYNSLIEGKARIPSELDDDPEASRAEMAACRRECEKARLQKQIEKEAQAALNKKRKEEAADHVSQKAEELANKRVVKEAEKAERARKRTEKAQERAQQALEVQKKYQARSSRAKNQAAVAADISTGEEAVTPVEKDVPPSDNTVARTEKVVVPTEKALSPTKKIMAPIEKRTVPFTSDTPDPRKSLSLPDLRRLCVARGLKVIGKTKEMLLSDLRDGEHKWKLYKLKDMCSPKSLPTSGTKALLRHRLAVSSIDELALLDF